MTVYALRRQAGDRWEDELPRHLTDRGWLTADFGQAQIPEEFRRVLRKWQDPYGRPTLIRWMADKIIVHPDRGRIALVDAKAELSDTDNYSIELNALEAGEATVSAWRIPVFYVWPDLGVMTPEIVRQRWNRRLDGKKASGSKTPFLLVDKYWRLEFDRVFGSVLRRGA